jgi:phage anti-repressor protein
VQTNEVYGRYQHEEKSMIKKIKRHSKLSDSSQKIGHKIELNDSKIREMQERDFKKRQSRRNNLKGDRTMKKRDEIYLNLWAFCN